jgi:hypothetical protein
MTSQRIAADSTKLPEMIRNKEARSYRVVPSRSNHFFNRDWPRCRGRLDRRGTKNMLRDQFRDWSY